MSGAQRESALSDLREAVALLRGSGEPAHRPPPTPSEGPDPYGNPDPEWLRIDWREHLRWIEVEGARLNVVELGPGDPDAPALLLVHGLEGCWQNWLETIPALARTHRVIAVDLPGFGHSPMPSWEISVPAYAACLAELLERLDAQGAAVAGNSLGGLVGLELCAAGGHPSLTLVSAAGISSADVKSGPAVMAGRLLLGLSPLFQTFQEQAIRRPRLRKSAFRTIFHDPAALRRELLFEHYRNGSGRPAFLPALEAVAGYVGDVPLEELDLPVLVVWGRDDMIVPVGDSAGFERRLPDVRTVIMDGTGHLPQLERPVRFNRILSSFLAETVSR